MQMALKSLHPRAEARPLRGCKKWNQNEHSQCIVDDKMLHIITGCYKDDNNIGEGAIHMLLIMGRTLTKAGDSTR